MVRIRSKKCCGLAGEECIECWCLDQLGQPSLKRQSKLLFPWSGLNDRF